MQLQGQLYHATGFLFKRCYTIYVKYICTFLRKQPFKTILFSRGIGMIKKLHNPKSYAPAVYIPCWLIQVNIKLLSNGAKMLYGRLSQWASSDGTVYRSIPQLSEELGCSERSIEEYLRELKNVKLIGTFHPQAGGINHYEFYDHEWMREPIKEQLTYKEDKFTLPHPSVVPTTSECGTPPHPSVDINIKEIKVNKITNKPPIPPKGGSERFEEFWTMYPVKASKKTCLEKWKKLHLDSIADYILVKLYEQIQKDDGWKNGYCPNPLTYINQHKWDDEIKLPKKSGNALSNFMHNQQQKGVVIDEHGNDYDPFSNLFSY